MANKKTIEPDIGEQLDLIDVGPANMETLAPLVGRYRKAVAAHGKTTKELAESKETLLDEVHRSGLEPLEGGAVKFRCGGAIVTIKAQKDKITIKDVGEPNEP